MPPRAGDERAPGIGYLSARDPGMDGTALEHHENKNEIPWSMGADLGTMGQAVNSSSDLLGLQLFYGGRCFFEIPFSEIILFSPGIGFYGRTQGTRAAGVNQFIVDLSAGLHYALTMTDDWKLLTGIDQGVEGLFSQLMVYQSAEFTPAIYRYRIGPSLGLAYQMDDDFRIQSFIRAGKTFGESNRTFYGLSVGIGYSM